MNQEIKDKLQQAADKSTEKGYSSEHPAKWHYKDGFTNGAQTILENPSEWGLWRQYDVVKHVNEVAVEASKVGRELAERGFKSQLAKYRGFLESIDEDLVFLEDCLHHSEGDLATIARKKIQEALKQEDKK